MKLFLSLITVFLIGFTSPAQAQFGKFLKDKANDIVDKGLDKAKEEAKSGLNKEIAEERAKYDTANFSYAFALSDDAASYEAKQTQKILFNVVAGDLGKEEEDDVSDAIMTGETFYAAGSYLLAEVYYNAAYFELNRRGETTSNDYMKVTANLGLLYHTTGRFNQAQVFTEEAYDTRKQFAGVNSAGYAASTNNLALLYKDLGRYNEAEKLMDEAVKVNRRNIGAESMEYAITLNNQAILFQEMGRYEEAEMLLKKAMDVADESIGTRSGNYQKFLTNLAILYQQMGRYADSEAMYQRVIELKERRFGKAHPDYAHMLSNLASLYMEMGRYDEVETLLIDANQIYEKKLGEKHPSYASSVMNLGNFYRSVGKYDQASPLLEKTLDIRKDIYGPNHPEYAEAQEYLAILKWKQRYTDQAIRLYHQSLDQSLKFINTYFPPMSETEKARYWDKLRLRFQRYYNFVKDVGLSHPDLAASMYDYHIATKALLLNSSNKIRQAILNSGDQKLIDDYLRWIDKKEKLAHLYTYTREELAEQKVNLDALEREANDLEKSLSERSNLFSEGYAQKSVSYRDILSNLPSGSAAIELVQVRNFDDRFTDNLSYIALILHKDESLPETVNIENGTQLDSRYYNFYKNAIKSRIEDPYSFAQFWKPIYEKVKYVSTLYISMDGIYNQINLNTLQTPEKSYLLDKQQMILVSNTKELALPESGHTQTKEAFLLGNPEYGNTGAITPLPGTRVEVQNIQRLLSSNGYQVNAKVQEQATETSIKKLQSPRMVHIATHGYFLEDVNTSKQRVFGVNVAQAKNNPLLRSGLLLAGAGSTVTDQSLPNLNEEDNGILTAYEAMNLPLDQSELVVLSACETGLGDVKAGEGVYGLQRAFLVAGADALIMSLWKVSDDATQELMSTFYASWLRSGDKLKAFRDAQLKLKQKYPEPFFWGAFVLIGR